MQKPERKLESTRKHPENLELGLDEHEAAEILSVKPRTLSDWRLRGVGPKFVKCGRRVTYRPDDLREYLEANRRSSTSDHTQRQATAMGAT